MPIWESCTRMLQDYVGPAALLVVIIAAGWLILWLLISIVILIFAPRAILWINEKIKDLVLELPDFMPRVATPLRYALGVGFFHYHPRVLNAWIKKQLHKGARAAFEGIQAVKERAIHIDLPVTLTLPNEGKAAELERLPPQNLRMAAAQTPFFLLITGEGGAGKTSLACRVARWAMSPNRAERICKHLMIPVFLEYPLHGETLVDAVRARLRILIGEAEPVTEGLFQKLIASKRILVIIDRLSEMDDETREKVRRQSLDSPVNALVVTSRRDDELPEIIRRSVLRPCRIEDENLYVFLDGYMKERKVPYRFEAGSVSESCLRLTLIVGERDTTPLLARLYADSIAAGMLSGEEERLPEDIPSLMLFYLNDLNRKVEGVGNRLENPLVHKCAQIVAWECLKETFRPMPVSVERACAALAQVGMGREHLRYLDERLHIVRVDEPGEEAVRFTLDPLAEYLAAMHLVRSCGQDETKWRAFIESARGKSAGTAPIKGFLLAVRDCCLAPNYQTAGTCLVADELANLVGLTADMVREADTKQRVRLNVVRLRSTNAWERMSGADALGAIGPEAKAAVPALAQALKDKDCDVRLYAAVALGKIGSEAGVAVPALIEALKDEDLCVRMGAEKALGEIGPTAMPALIEALKDEDLGVRTGAEKALGGIGPAAVPALIEALKEEDLDVRCSAAQALGEIGAQATVAVCDLIEALRDENLPIRWRAAAALGKIGPGAKAAVPALIEGLRDKEFTVRWVAAQALGEIGAEARAAASDLIGAMNDGESIVQSHAVRALGEIGPEARAAVPFLIEALKNVSSDVCENAWRALVKIGPPAVASLVEALRNEDSNVSWRAAHALADMGPEAKAGVPALIDALKDGDLRVRWLAADALGEIGPEPEAAMPALIGALKDEDSIVRYSAANALGKMGADAKGALAALRGLDRDHDQTVRNAAAEAIKRITGDAKREKGESRE